MALKKLRLPHSSEAAQKKNVTDSSFRSVDGTRPSVYDPAYSLAAADVRNDPSEFKAGLGLGSVARGLWLGAQCAFPGVYNRENVQNQHAHKCFVKVAW